MEKTAPKSSSMAPAKSERRDGRHLQSILLSRTSRRLDSSHIAPPRDGEEGAKVLLYATSQVRKERWAPPPEHIAIQDVAPARLLPYCASSEWRRYRQGGPLCRQPSQEGEMGAAAISILPSMGPRRWTVSRGLRPRMSLVDDGRDGISTHPHGYGVHLLRFLFSYQGREPS
jgi:hypothetical protein